MRKSKKEQSAKKTQRTRQIMAWIGIIAIFLFIITACVCMVLGDFGMGLASCFCLVVVPIMIYLLITVYDRVHKFDGVNEELLATEEEDEAAGKE